MKGARVAFLSVVVLGELVLAPIASGQTAATGALIGTVNDSSGAVMPKARVTVVSQAIGAERTTETDATGVYRVPLLSPGRYSVQFAAEGFKTQRRLDITINVTETHTLNVVMEVGEVGETITVEAGTALVQPETTTLGRLVSEVAVKNLPLSTRNYTQILHMSPGVVADLTNAGQLGRNTQDVYVNGMRAIDNNFQLDGAPVNNFHTGRAGDSGGSSGISIPNVDAIQEVKIQTGMYDAGYGRGVGANVNVVTKSGTNEFHGTIFEFLRNNALNANDFFLNRTGQPRPIFRQNQFGGVLGGPILKDRLFFFTSYQGTRQTNGVGSSSLRSALLPPLTDDRSRTTLGSQFCGQGGANGGVAVACDGSNINPVAVALLNHKLPNGQFLIPTPQVIQANGLGFSVFSVPSTFTEDQFIGNLDYLVSKNNTLSGRSFYSRDPQVVSFTSATLPGGGAETDFQNRNFVLRLSSVLTRTLINEARFSFKRNFGNLQTLTPVNVADIGMTPLADLLTLPIITVQGLFSFGGGFNDNFKTAVTSFEAADQVSWTRGRHNVRAGFEVERIIDNFDLFGGKRGSITFLSFPDFLLGMSAAQNGSNFSNIFLTVGYNGLTDRQFRVNDYVVFVQDDFKIHPQLTLNLGMRWEVYGGVIEKRGRLVNFWPELASNVFPAGGTLTGFVTADNFSGVLPPGVVSTGNKTCCANARPLHNWGPRVGLAWRPFARTNRFVVRAGYGIFYARTSGNDVLQLNLQPPFLINFRNSGVGNAAATFQVPFNPAPPPLSAFPVWIPRTASTRLTVENLDRDWHAPMAQAYSLNIQYEFLANYMLEVGYVGTHGTRALRFREVNQARLASPQNPINGVTTNTVANASLRVPVLGMDPGGLLQMETAGFITHHALQTSVRKRFSRGFEFQTSYTFGKTIDDIPASTGGATGTPIFGGFFSNDVNNGRQARGTTDFDRRHRFVYSFVWDLPGFRKGAGFAGKLLSGWQLSGVTTFQSGRALTILDQRAGTVYGAFSLTLFQMRAEMCPGFTHGDITTSGSVDNRLDNYFNNAAFCPPPQIGDGTGFGSLGRGVARGPDQRNFDIAITKRTPIKGSKARNIEFRAEFFNAFNTPQFGDPGLNVTSPDFGRITGTTVSARLVQFALKLNF